VGVLVLSTSLLVVAVAQASIAISVADRAHVDGATAPGQWVSALTGLLLTAGAVPCVAVGMRRLRGAGDPGRRTPV
jgi:hypothetical protein